MRARGGIACALLLASCSGGAAGFGSRTFDQDVAEIADLGDAFAVILSDRTVAIAPDDPSAPLQRLGRVDGEVPLSIAVAGPLLLTTSGTPTHDHQQVQAFSRTDHSVRGLASGLVSTCARGDAPVVFVLRDDRAWWGRQYDPHTLAVTHEGLLSQYGELGGCEGDAWGLVLSEGMVHFDADNDAWLATRDTPESGERRLQVPGELRGWDLRGGTIYALLHGRNEEGNEARVYRIDRQGGAATPIGQAMANAEYLRVGDRWACAWDDAIHPPHHVWRIALDGSNTEVVWEGDASSCVGIRDGRAIALRDHTLVALPE